MIKEYLKDIDIYDITKPCIIRNSMPCNQKKKNFGLTSPFFNKVGRKQKKRNYEKVFPSSGNL
jgi:hypothetical protein